MAGGRPTHDVSIMSTYKSGGEEKTRFTKVGSGWLNDKGSIFVVIEEGISVSGKLIIKEANYESKEKSESKGSYQKPKYPAKSSNKAKFVDDEDDGFDPNDPFS